MESRAKHKLCRRIGSCIWGSPKCPSVKRPYPSGPHGKARQKKLSTYGQLLIEKQKVKAFYGITEKQLNLTYQRAKRGKMQTDERLLVLLETRLSSFIYRAGLAPTIHAARQFVTHRHIKINGKTVDRCSYFVSPGDEISIDIQKSPSIAQAAKNTNAQIPPYIEVDKENCKVKLLRKPLKEEIPTNFEVMRVIEYYAR